MHLRQTQISRPLLRIVP